MWSPTHVQVTVCRVKGLITKGKNGTNDAFVTIALGKEKFQTSVKQKASPDLEWNEECELPIPTQGNTAEIVLTALHQNFIGVDEFLGMTTLPLSNFDVYQQAKTRWYPLKSKPGQESKTKYRGEIEVRVAFTVKSGSLLDLSKKEKLRGSFGQLGQAAQSFGGSLLSLGGKDRKGIKKLASSVGHKLKLPGRSHSAKEDKNDDHRLSRHSSGRFSDKFSSGEPDPGVISEDDDEFRFDELSHKSSGSSLNLAGSHASDSLENLGGGELLRRNSMNRSGTLPSRLASTSSSSTSINQGRSQQSGSKGVFQDDSANDWNQKLFGKQSKVIPPPSFKEEESTIVGGVPSIIIQDSFVVPEEPSVFTSPRSSDKAKKSHVVTVNTTANDEEFAKPPTTATYINQSPKLSSSSPSSLRNQTESPESSLFAPAASPTASETSQVGPPKPRQRKDTGGKAGEEDDLPSARMPKSVAPSLPIESTLSPASQTDPPVPKPRSLVSNFQPSQPVSSPANPFGDDDEPIEIGRSYPLQSAPVSVVNVSSAVNPFDDDDPVEIGRSNPSVTPKPFTSSPANPFEEDDEPVEIGRSYAGAEAASSVTVSYGIDPFGYDPFDAKDDAYAAVNPFDEENDPVEIASPALMESIIPGVRNDEVVIVSPLSDSSHSRDLRQKENPFFRTNTIDTILETTEIVSEEDSVCLLLEQAIEGHDDVHEAINNVSVIRIGDECSPATESRNPLVLAVSGDLVESSVDDLPLDNKATVSIDAQKGNPVDVLELYNEETVWTDGATATFAAPSDDEDEIQKRKISLTPALKTMVLKTPGSEFQSDLGSTLDELDEASPVQDVQVVQLATEEASPISESRTSDLFIKETEKISPVERAGQRPDYTTPPADTVEASATVFRKDRYYSLFSTPTSNERGNDSLGVVTLDWSVSSSHNNSQASRSEGYVGSDLGSASSSLVGAAEQTKSTDSAVVVEEKTIYDTDVSMSFMQPKKTSLTPLQDQSMRPDLSWDNYDMGFVTPPDDVAHSNAAGSMPASRKEELTLPSIQEETAVSKKRISLAPSLKTMVLDDSSPTNESTSSDLDSPLMEQAAAAETHRQKMAASFDQRVVVGEEMSSVGNNDFNSSSNSMSTPRKPGRDLQHQYQGKSREELIGLLQSRDNEVKDLKEYIDTLLLRVIEACPTVLQTPDRKNK